MESVQGCFSGQPFEFVNFTNGYIWCEGPVWSARHGSNPFISLVEDATNYSTVYCGNHMELDEQGPVVQIEQPPGWLQVVHGRNLANRAWGTPEPEVDLGAMFGIKP